MEMPVLTFFLIQKKAIIVRHFSFTSEMKGKSDIEMKLEKEK